MQLPQNPFPFGLGFLRQPQPGAGAQVNTEPQIKTAASGRSDAIPGAKTAAKGAQAAGTPGLATAKSLEEAVLALRAEGRLPARGSLIDLRA